MIMNYNKNQMKNYHRYTEYSSNEDHDEENYELTAYVHELPCLTKNRHETECLHGNSHLCHKQPDTDFFRAENKYYEKQTLHNHPVMKRRRGKVDCYNSNNDEAQTENYDAYRYVHALPHTHTYEQHIHENELHDHEYAYNIQQMKSYHPIKGRRGSIHDDDENAYDMHHYEHIPRLQINYGNNEKKYHEVHCRKHEATFCTVHNKYDLNQIELYAPVNREQSIIPKYNLNVEEQGKIDGKENRDKFYRDRHVCFKHLVTDLFTMKSKSIVEIKAYYPRKGKINYINPKNEEKPNNNVDKDNNLHQPFSHFTQTHERDKRAREQQESGTKICTIENKCVINQKQASIPIDKDQLTDIKSSTANETQSRNEIVKPLVSRLVMTEDNNTNELTLLNKKSSNTTRMNWNNYHRLAVIYKFLDDLEYDFPAICTVGAIGSSLEGRDIKILRISNGNAKNTSVWMDAGIHAREWIAPAVATYVANHIARNFNSLPDSVTNKDWYILPVMNPDGYEYTHTHDRMWRKNRAWVRGQCVGVDLNRNFSYGWGGRGSSENPYNSFFRGSKPFSEPESSAVRDIILNSGISFEVYITLHSFGQLIILPFAYRDDLCPDYVRLLEGATVMSKAIYESSGNIYKVGISKDVMYKAAGTSNDWSHGEAKIPYCYLIELRSKKHKFQVPQEEIEETGQEILSCVKALMEFVDNYQHEKEKLAPPKEGAQIWQVTFTEEGQRTFVKNLDTMGAINIWKEEPSTMDIMVECSKVRQVAGMLHEREIPYSISVGDVGLLLEREQGSTFSKNMNIRKNSASRRSMDWKNYHRLDVIYEFLHDLASEYPYLCKVYVIGKSVEGRDIKMLKISNGDADNIGVWLDGSIHSREWISTAVVTYIADKIARTFNQQPECVTNKDWYILPVMNPDGYEYTHTHDRMWRKNRARYGECVGVDLNRNFSYGWGEKGEEGSSEDPGNIFYRGPKPFSEPESNAVKRVILGSDTPFKAFLSFHSYGEVIIFPWGYTADACPDYVELLEGGAAMAKAIYGTNGHTYRVGSTKDLMYFASGTSIDWSYAVANIPFSYMVELKGKKNRFLLPKEEIISTSIEAMNGVVSLMQFIDISNLSPRSSVC